MKLKINTQNKNKNDDKKNEPISETESSHSEFHGNGVKETENCGGRGKWANLCFILKFLFQILCELASVAWFVFIMSSALCLVIFMISSGYCKFIILSESDWNNNKTTTTTTRREQVNSNSTASCSPKEIMDFIYEGKFSLFALVCYVIGIGTFLWALPKIWRRIKIIINWIHYQGKL